MTPCVLGVRLRGLRKQRCWSMAGLAHRSGVSQATISSLEKGVTHGVSIGTLRLLATAFALPMAVVLGEQPVPPVEWARGGAAWQQVRAEIDQIRGAA